MCWDKETSIITFVLGTVINIFNIFYFKETVITVLSLVWQWVLLMQLFEAFAWDSQPGPGEKCSKTNRIAANGALIANVVQPIIVALAIIAFTPVSIYNKVIAMVVIIGYICWLLYGMNQNSPFGCLTPAEGCRNLDYNWWRMFPGNALPYVFTIAIVILLLYRPIDLAWFTLFLIMGSLLLSSTFYSCGIGSTWCWFAAFIPLATGVYWYVTRGPP